MARLLSLAGTGLLVLCLGRPAVSNAEPDPFARSVADGRKALAKRAYDEARAACRAARAQAEEPAFGGPRTAEAWALCGDVARADDRAAAAAKAYARAARAAVHAPKLRRKLLSKRRQAAFAAKAKRAAKAVTALLAHDAKVQAVLRKPRRRGRGADQAAEQMLEAHRDYRADKDTQQARLARAARALVLAYTDKRALAEKLARRVLRQPAPRTVEVAAWRALYQARVSGDDRPGAVDAALGLERVAADGEAPPYRGRVLEAACRALDEAQGPGACTRHQLAHGGPARLSDHSRRRVRALDEGVIAEVHADALPVLQACVLALAKADPDTYRGESLRFSWAIGPAGAPLGVEVRPRRHAEATAGCRARIEGFRYPRTPATAERRNVVVPYQLD